MLAFKLFNGLRKNKKGDMAIALLVFLVLLTTLIATYSFVVSPKKVEAKVYDVSVVQSILLKEDLVNFYVQKIAEDSLRNSFDESGNFNGQDFRNNFINGFKKVNFDEDYLKELKKRVIEENFDMDISPKDNVIVIIIKDFSLEEVSEKITVEYSFDVSRIFKIRD